MAYALPPPPPPEVTWDAPASCPDEAAVQTAVRDRVGESGPATPVEAHVRVEEADAGRFAATVDLDGQSRRIEAESCTALADAVALLVAIHVDAVRSGEGETDRPDPAPPKPSVDADAVHVERPLESPSPPPPDPVEPSAPKASLVGFVRPEAAMAFQIVGPIAGAVGLAGGVRIGRFRVEGQARFVPPHELRLGKGRPSARVLLATLGVAACFEPGIGRVTFPLCAALYAGTARGRGLDGVDEPEPGWRPWLSARATAGLRVSVAPRVALSLDAGPEIPIVSPSFVLGPAGIPVHEAGPVGGVVAIGVELDFSSRRTPRRST